MTEQDSLRVDKYLWFARFFKTRSLATKRANGGRIRINGNKIKKSSDTVRIGDILTFAQGNEIRVIRVLNLGTRRGPAQEAQSLYEDITPNEDTDEATRDKLLAKM
ncbi:MAG: RNA-binding S4 domain-containing protein [Pseudomonadota bacterium]|jgi:ribosome-associated heat shock protein Hsp15|nr:RNA-binding S4 domain-containing protein [Candidatus Micropelagos thuwalensis]MEC7176564.1 RNA-binding S4 domain-containing protein [Pseudomonadota bacterium]